MFLNDKRQKTIVLSKEAIFISKSWIIQLLSYSIFIDGI